MSLAQKHIHKVHEWCDKYIKDDKFLDGTIFDLKVLSEQNASSAALSAASSSSSSSSSQTKSNESRMSDTEDVEDSLQFVNYNEDSDDEDEPHCDDDTYFSGESLSDDELALDDDESKTLSFDSDSDTPLIKLVK